MKLLHLGDLHIGKTVNDFSMIDDQKYILDQIFAMIKQQEADAVIIAGDVYDKAVPSEQAVRLFDYFIRKLADDKITTYIISGNHDSDERLNFGSSLFESSGIHILGKYQGELVKKVYQDAFGPVNIYMLPFVKASQVKHFYPEETINSYDDAVRAAIRNTDINTKERNILLAHQFVAGKSEEPILSGSENLAVQNVGTVEKIGVECFDDFDYVALGHIHSNQRVGRDTVRYSGSPLKYSLSEINTKKSVPIITLKEKQDIIIENMELVPLRDMRHLKGKFEQLLNKENIVDEEDYIYVTLTDEDPIADAISIFRQYYPNIMKLDYDNTHTREIETIDLSKVTQEKSFQELISDFYQMMYGCDISEDELKLMIELAGEAGIVHETD